MMKIFAILLTVCLISMSSVAVAAEGAKKPKDMDWPHEGITGTYDRAALQRGYQVYKQVCSACHSMDRVYYRNLADLGYNEAQIKALAAEYEVEDGPNDEGEMFMRPARPSDAFKAPFPNIQAAKYANNGAYPPDLSLIVNARHYGEDYIYALLTGYKEEAPHGHTLLDGQYWNEYMPGHIIAMAPPLSDGLVDYANEDTPETVEQYSRDVAQFLTWASNPKMEERKRLGLRAILFLIVFTGIMYAVKRRIWAHKH